jgi:hypothetical protein
VDNNAESRGGTISALNGLEPVIETFADPDQEASAVARWLADRIAEGVPPHEIGMFVRASGQLRRARAAAKTAGAAAVELSDKIEMTQARISIGTMHLEKGLEFRAIAVMAWQAPAGAFHVQVTLNFSHAAIGRADRRDARHVGRQIPGQEWLPQIDDLFIIGG